LTYLPVRKKFNLNSNSQGQKYPDEKGLLDRPSLLFEMAFLFPILKVAGLLRTMVQLL